jgi:predicted GNAT superfamily acetyltransferase
VAGAAAARRRLRRLNGASQLAADAARAAGVELRPLTSIADAEAILAVMTATWGPYQSLPREEILALAYSGNVPHGAFDGDELIGFVLGWAGVDEDGLHLHSHMLAALPDRRHRGVGYALKLAQRERCLERGIRVVRWTFDPLVARNAYFNLHKLGAVGDRFHRDFYGPMEDAINRGDRSDRLVVRWDLQQEPGPPAAVSTPAEVALGAAPDGSPQRHPTGAGATHVRTVVPREHLPMRGEQPDVAKAWRDVVADVFEELFGQGLVPTDFDIAESAYVWTVPDDHT